MNFSLSGANIVILAENHNPTIVSKEWLVKNDILKEDVLNFAHIPVASMVETNNYNLVVDQENLQLAIKNINRENLDYLPKIITKYVDSLPETPYKAIGFNFIYEIQENDENLKDTFMINDAKLLDIFPENYLFGGIIKFPLEDFKVTLTIQSSESGNLIGNFNFHYPSGDINKIKEKLTEFIKILEKSEEILKRLLNV